MVFDLEARAQSCDLNPDQLKNHFRSPGMRTPEFPATNSTSRFRLARALVFPAAPHFVPKDRYLGWEKDAEPASRGVPTATIQ